MHLEYGEHIRRAIRDRGYTASQVADALGVSRQTVSSWLNNRADMPLYRLVELADILGCTTDELLGRTERSGNIINMVYDAVNDDGKAAMEQFAEMAWMNPRFLKERPSGEVRA